MRTLAIIRKTYPEINGITVELLKNGKCYSFQLKLDHPVELMQVGSMIELRKIERMLIEKERTVRDL